MPGSSPEPVQYHALSRFFFRCDGGISSRKGTKISRRQSPCERSEKRGRLLTQIISRAVGTAVGANPIAYLIPCHRVILSTGAFGNYRYGALRKKAIFGWEQAQLLTPRV